MLSETGGELGLYWGASVLSLFEIFELLINLMLPWISTNNDPYADDENDEDDDKKPKDGAELEMVGMSATSASSPNARIAPLS